MNTPKQEGGVRISEQQRKVLRAYYREGDSEEYCGGYGIYFRTIAKRTKLPLRQVRHSARALAHKGLLELVRGLFSDDGLLAGSGYGCTRAGADFIKSESPNV